MATITINTPESEDARLLAGFGKRLRLGDAEGNSRPATLEEVKAFLIQTIVNVVQDEETLAIVPPAPINPS